MVFQLIAATSLKLLKKVRRPCGIGHLIRVVEERVRVGRPCALEGLFDVFQVVGNGFLVEMVHHQSLTARRSTLHLHYAVAHVDGNHAPRVFLVTLRRCPCQFAVDHQISHVGRSGRLLAWPVYSVNHHLLQARIFPVFLWHHQWQVGNLLAYETCVHEHHLARTLLQRHPWASKRPSRSRGHVELNAVGAALLLRVAEHLHPTVGQIGDVLRVVVLNAIDGGDFQGADSVLGILRDVPFQVLLVHSRSQPPPSCTGLGFGLQCRPLLGEGGSRSNHHQHDGCQEQYVVFRSDHSFFLRLWSSSRPHVASCLVICGL